MVNEYTMEQAIQLACTKHYITRKNIVKVIENGRLNVYGVFDKIIDFQGPFTSKILIYSSTL